MGPSVPRLGAVRCGKSCRSLNVKDCSVTVSYGRAVKAGQGLLRSVKAVLARLCTSSQGL